MSYSFFATTPKNLEALLAEEIRQLGIDNARDTRGGATFQASLAEAYRVCLWSRVASRVLMPLTSFPAADAEQLYDGVMAIDWSEHLEVDGTLVVNGEIMNLAWGYGEIFEYHLLNEKPFFFYEKGGQVGISYGGQELPVSYDEVIHGECCGGMNNPRFSEHMAWFYGLRDRVWYYVEIGNYD